jgi:hypothetical protein
MSETSQARLLLAVLQQRWDEAERLARCGPPQPGVFVDLCRQCDVPTWIHTILDGADRGDLVGDETMENLGAIRAKIQRDNLLLFARAEQAFDALLAAGVVPVVLKGLDLVHRLYERFDGRTLDDVDLLVDRRQLPDALAALRGAGWSTPPEPACIHYIRSSHHLPLRSPGEVHVEFELHWNLAQEIRFRVDGAGLIERAVPCSIGGRSVLRLADHDIVAHLLLHHFTHYFDRRLKWAVDMRAISEQPGFDWAAVAKRIRSWGATAVSAMSLEHLARSVPDWVPREIRDLLPVDGWRRLATRPLRSTHPLDLFRGTRNRKVQYYLAAVLLERPATLPGWIYHRMVRDRRAGSNPLDDGVSLTERNP